MLHSTRRFVSSLAAISLVWFVSLGIAAAGGWSAIGPRTARVTTLAVDPALPSVLFAGTWGGGVYRSLDGGRSWRRSNAGLTDTDVIQVAISPHDPDTLLAATWYGGLFRSRDRGESWERLHEADFQFGCFSCVAFDPDGADLAYTASADEVLVLRFDDEGSLSWEILGRRNSSLHLARGIWVDPSDSATLLVPDAASGIFRSQDAGRTWELVQVPEADISEIAFDPRNPDRILAAALDGLLLESRDRGATWSELARLPLRRTANLVFDPVEEDTIFAFSGTELLVSRDDGLTWSVLPNLGTQLVPGALATTVVPSGLGMVFAGTGGVAASSDRGGSWTWLSQPFDAARVAAISTDPRDPSRVWAATSTAGLFASSDGGSQWRQGFDGLPQGSTSALAADPRNPDVLIVGVVEDGLYRSLDGGDSWTRVTAEGSPLAQVDLLSAVDTGTGSTQWFAAARWGNMYRSRDGGASWSRIADSFLRDITSAVVASPHSPATLFVGESSHRLVVSRDGGETWAEAANNLPERESIWSIAFSPDLPGVLWAGGAGGQVYRSKTDGFLWAPAGDPVADSPVVALVPEPGDGSRIWAATYLDGVFLTTDGGQSWSSVSGGLTNPRVSCLVPVPGRFGLSLLAGTNGGGIFRLEPARPRQPAGRKASGATLGSNATRHTPQDARPRSTAGPIAVP